MQQKNADSYTLEPHYSTNVGVHKKSVLYQNSVNNEGLIHRKYKQWEPSLDRVITKFVQ